MNLVICVGVPDYTVNRGKLHRVEPSIPAGEEPELVPSGEQQKGLIPYSLILFFPGTYSHWDPTHFSVVLFIQDDMIVSSDIARKGRF